MKGTVAAVVITLNEEKHIETCLSSVSWMDEVIVVDAGSQDRTCAIAERFASRIFTRQFDDFSSQRNFGADQASSDWVFAIDADEQMSGELQSEIQAVLERPIATADCFRVPRRNVYFGRSVQHVMGKDEPVRLYRRSVARYQGLVHEKAIGGREESLAAPLLHYSCSTVREWMEKHRKYVRLDSEQEYAEGRRFSWKRLFGAPFQIFLFRYLNLQGWKDGYPGLLVSLEMSLSGARGELELRRLGKRRQG